MLSGDMKHGVICMKQLAGTKKLQRSNFYDNVVQKVKMDGKNESEAGNEVH